MKRLLIIATLTLFYVTSIAQINNYIIEGTNLQGNLEGKWVYLYNPDKEIIEDSTLIENGKFTFKGQINGNSLRHIKIKRRASVNLILEAGDIKIDIDNHSIGGTPLNDILNKCNIALQVIRRETTGSYTDKDLVRINEISAELDRKSLDALVPYIKANTDNALAAQLILNILSSSSNIETFNILENLAGKYTLSYRPFLSVKNRFSVLNKTKVGKLFVDFTIKNGNLDGTPVSLSDYVGKGKYILVDFWASWCAPCRAEIPNIAKVYKEFKGDRFDVLSIAVDDLRANTLKAAKEHGISWNQIIDAQNIPLELYGIKGIPQIMLFGPDGMIIARDLRGDNVRAKISDVLTK